MTAIKLTELQRQVLEHAIDKTEDRLVWLPEHLQAGPRAKVLQALEQKGLITESGDHGWFVTDEAYASLGRVREYGAPSPSRTIRRDTKQARVIELLRRPKGATLDQLVEATGWQAHTVRGTLSGTLKKRLGLTVTSAKETDQGRVYRIS
jgi:hypothetical protein